MTAASWLLLSVAAASAVGDWVAVARRSKPLEYVCKPVTLAALTGVAVTLDPAHEAQRWLFAGALVLSLAGDVFLMLPRDRFVAGLASFLAAHVAYGVGFASSPGGSVGRFAAAAVVLTPLLVVLALRYARAARAVDPRLAGPVIAYIAAIAAMTLMAWLRSDAFGIVGALLFMLSDSLIAETRFVRPHAGAPVTIMVTYHLGQAGLVLSLLP